MNESLQVFSIFEGSLLLFSRPYSKHLKLFKSYCDTIVTLLAINENPQEVQSLCTDFNLNWIWMPIKAINLNLLQDNDLFNTLNSQIETLENLLRSGSKILVHCAAGVHRTGFVSYNLLRKCGLSQSESLEAIASIRPTTITRMGQHRKEIAELFYQKSLKNPVEFSQISTFNMIETDYIKSLIKPLLWVKATFNSSLCKVSFIMTCSNLLKIIPKIEVVCEVLQDFTWKNSRESGFEVPAKLRTLSECELILKEYINFSTSKNSCKIAGNQCYFDKEFLYALMPDVLNLLDYRILDLSSISEAQNSELQQTLTPEEDIMIFKALKNKYSVL